MDCDSDHDHGERIFFTTLGQKTSVLAAMNSSLTALPRLKYLGKRLGVKDRLWEEQPTRTFAYCVRRQSLVGHSNKSRVILDNGKLV